MKSIHLLTTLACSALVMTSAVFAGSPDRQPLSLMTPPAPESPFHWYFGETVASKNYHYSHGINNGDNGPYFQTDLNLFASLYKGSGFINQVKFNLFTWYQVTSKNEAPATHDLRRWNEFDANASIDVTFAKNFTFTAQSLNFFSPNNAFHEIHEVEFALSYDDSWLLGPFALHPALNYQRELVGNGAIEPYGNLFEILAFPGVQAVKGGVLPVKLTFPLALGLGDNRFFGGNTFGYFASTVQTDIGLKFIPQKFGSWASTSTMTYYETNDAVAARNNGKNHELVFTTGINVSF